MQLFIEEYTCFLLISDGSIPVSIQSMFFSPSVPTYALSTPLLKWAYIFTPASLLGVVLSKFLQICFSFKFYNYKIDMEQNFIQN